MGSEVRSLREEANKEAPIITQVSACRWFPDIGVGKDNPKRVWQAYWAEEEELEFWEAKVWL